jgi:hypothetical protein
VASVRLAIVLASFQLTSLRGTIGGIVIKAATAIEQPLRDARLELTGGPGTPLVVRTDGNGRFIFSGLAPGEYRLALTCDGFIRQESPRKIVLGPGQQVRNLRFELNPAPTTAGRVLDNYGQPIANIMIAALRRSYDVRGNARLFRAATALTDDRGEYRIFWLDPGEYFFSAESPPPDSSTEGLRVFPTTYFQDVTTAEDAKPLHLDIGREIHVDFRLPRPVALWTVNGQTINGITGRSVSAAITLTAPAQDPSPSRYQTQSMMIPTPGPFTMENVVPGTYILMAKSGSGDQEIAAFQRIVLRPIPYAPFVRPPQYGVTVSLAPPFSINGRLFVESRDTAPDLRDARVSLISVDPDLPSPRIVSAPPDGQFILNGMVPGTYVLETSNLPRDLYLKALPGRVTPISWKCLLHWKAALQALFRFCWAPTGAIFRLPPTMPGMNFIPGRTSYLFRTSNGAIDGNSIVSRAPATTER